MKRSREELAEEEEVNFQKWVSENVKKKTKIHEVEDETIRWIKEVEDCGIEEDSPELIDLEEEASQAWDDVQGGSLPVEAVREARKQEVGYMGQRGIWKVVPLAESWKNTGKAPVSVRWVDTNKGTPEEITVRSRLVARVF